MSKPIIKPPGKGGDTPLTPEQIRILNLLKPLANNRTLYYREGSETNPQEGDRRDTGLGLGKNGDEVYSGGKWVSKIQVGSVGTDSITLHKGLNDIKVKEETRTYNLVRKLKTMDGIQLGSSFSPLALTSSTKDGVNIYYPDKTQVQKFSGVITESIKTNLPAYYLFAWNNQDAIVKSFNFRTSKDSRIRLRLYYTTETDIKKAIANKSDDTMVYESLPDTEFKNPDDPNYGGILIPKGESETDLRNEMYLTNNKTYLIEFDSCIESNFLGSGECPFFEFNWWAERHDRVMCRESVSEAMEERLKNDITLNRGMWLTTRGMPSKESPDGDIRNLVGIYDDVELLVGDPMEQTVIQSIGKPQINMNGDRINMASEPFVFENALKRVFNGSELMNGQTGLLYQTIPKTYTMYDSPIAFPTYDITKNTIIAGMVMEFMISTRSDRQPLFTDGSANTTILMVLAGDRAVLETGFFRRDKEGNVAWSNITIDTSVVGKVDEGFTPANTPYKPSRDRMEEESKKWRFEAHIEGNGQYVLRLTDPNGGVWSFASGEKEGVYIGEGTALKVGSFQEDDFLKALNNVKVTLWDTLDDNKTITEIDETVTGIVPNKLITRYRKSTFDIASTDTMAIHKFPDLTKDFHTFFEPSASGVYRCFEMMDNIPDGYFAGDNDFYCFVYAVSEKYKTVEALDIRSGRRFTMCMLAGQWGQWFEWGINQGGQVPTLIYAKNYSAIAGTPTPLPIYDIDGVTKDDVFWVTCGTRGQAIQITDPKKLEQYSASYYTNPETKEFIYYMEAQGTDVKDLAVYKFVKTPVTPPRGGCPYITLQDVVGDLSNNTQRGDEFILPLTTKSIELMRNLMVTITTPGRWETTEVIFDGKAKYLFRFPWQPNGNWVAGDTVTYQLSWQDQNGMNYTAFEKIGKNIIV